MPVASLLDTNTPYTHPEDDSPYPEVRSAVANTDDPDMPVNTFRAWVIGIVWAILIPGMNQFFYFRYPSVTVGGVRAWSFLLLRTATDRDPLPPARARGVRTYTHIHIRARL